MRRARLLLVLLAAACDVPAVVVEPPPVYHEPHAWAGGSLRLTSDAFLTDGSVIVAVDGQSRPWERADSTSIVVALPEVNGVVQLRVERHGVTILLGEITLHGYVSRQTLPIMDPVPLAWPRGRGTIVGDIGGHLMLISPGTGAVTAFMPDSLYRPCASPRQGEEGIIVVGAKDSLGYCRALALMRSPSWTVVDSILFGCGGIYGGTVRLAGRTWISFCGQETRVDQRSATGWQSADLSGILNNIIRMEMPPDGRFAVPIGGVMPPGGWVPLYHASSPFSPPSLSDSGVIRSAEFTEDGDTLFVQIGDARSRYDSLFVFASATATRLHVEPLAAPFRALAVDDRGPWLYAFTPDSVVGGTLTIYDRGTMAVVAEQHAPGGNPWDPDFADVLMVTDMLGRRLHVVAWFDERFGAAPRTPAVAWTFSLLP